MPTSRHRTNGETDGCSRLLDAALWAVIAAAAMPAAAQESERSDENRPIEEIVVTGSRLPGSLTNYAGTVTVVDADTIDVERAITQDIGTILGRTVPGLGLAISGSTSNSEQNLRGRKAAVLIDGVPVSTPLRDGRRDLRSLSATAIQRVEVISGASALYGNGGVGGFINYITRKGGTGAPTLRTEVGATAISLTHPEDSFGAYINQSALGELGGVDFNVDLFYQRTNSFFDAEGDRIRPSPNNQGGLADSDIYNAFAKLGYDFGAQRIQGSVLYYDQKQDTDFNVVIPGDVDRGIKTRVEAGPRDPRATDEGTENLIVNLIYSHADVWGSSLQTQVYYQDYLNIFSFNPQPPSNFPGGGQSVIDSEKYGVRLDINSLVDWLGGGTVLWGLDYLNDTTGQPLVDGRIFAPFMDLESIAGFAQLQVNLNDRLSIAGGLRHEEVSIDVPSFLTLLRSSNVPITGGTIDNNATTFNFGLSYQLAPGINLYANYSEGFSVAEIGGVIRTLPEPTDLNDADIDAAIVENYEAGLRFNWSKGSGTIAAFRSTSEFGTTVSRDRLTLLRAPEETYGLELILSVAPTDRLELGATLSWTEGERDSDGDGDPDRDLPTNRVPPVKLIGDLSYRILDRWSARLEVIHSAERDPFDEVTAFGEQPIPSFTIVNLSSRVDLGEWGALTFGVENALNRDFFTTSSILRERDDRFSKAQGATAALRYMKSY